MNVRYFRPSPSKHVAKRRAAIQMTRGRIRCVLRANCALAAAGTAFAAGEVVAAEESFIADPRITLYSARGYLRAASASATRSISLLVNHGPTGTDTTSRAARSAFGSEPLPRPHF